MTDPANSIDALLQEGVNKKVIRECNLLQQLNLLTIQVQGTIITLRVKGELIACFSEILLGQTKLNNMKLRKIMTSLMEIVEFKAKQVRRKREEGDKHKSPTHKTKKRNEGSEDGTPMQVMLRKNTPKAGIQIDSSSSYSNVEKKKETKENARDKKSEQGSEKSEAFVFRFDPTQMQNYDQMEMGNYQLQPIDTPFSRDRFGSSIRQKDRTDMIKINIEKLLNFGDSSKQNSEASEPQNFMRQRKKAEPKNRAPKRRNLPKNLYVVDQSNVLKEKEDYQQETMQVTRRINTDASFNNSFNHINNFLDHSKLNFDNILKQLSLAQFQVGFSAIKQFQKSYYQTRSLLRSPINGDRFNIQQPAYFDENTDDNQGNRTILQQVQMPSSTNQMNLSFAPVDQSSMIKAMVTDGVGLNEITRDKVKGVKVKLFMQCLCSPEYKLVQSQPHIFGEIMLEVR